MSTFLYTITDCERSDRGVVLLPGIPSGLIHHPEVKQVRQGATIELRFPDGTKGRTVVVNYGVRVPIDLKVPGNVLELPFQITVPQLSEYQIVPIGTEVWLPSREERTQ